MFWHFIQIFGSLIIWSNCIPCLNSPINIAIRNELVNILIAYYWRDLITIVPNHNSPCLALGFCQKNSITFVQSSSLLFCLISVLSLRKEYTICIVLIAHFGLSFDIICCSWFKVWVFDSVRHIIWITWWTCQWSHPERNKRHGIQDDDTHTS